MNGKIVADGQPAAGGGGPSGGSLWLTARKLTGVGLISADGGSATGLMRGNYGESGGGGGRSFGGGFGLAELSLVCTLEWMEFRQAYPTERARALAGVRAAWADRATVVATRPHA